MLVGNDVVDLRDPETAPEALHPRFDTRAFTRDERAALRASPAAHALRWTLWAAKESAYKVAKKIDSAIRFLPRNFRVRQLAESRALVLHGLGSFDVWLESTDAWVHAVATTSAVTTPSAAAASSSVARSHVARSQSGAPAPRPPFSAGVERLQAVGVDPSLRVRELACAAVGDRLCLPPGRVHIDTVGRIPVALSGDRTLSVDLSLSHHGRFAAWACAAHTVPTAGTELLPGVRAAARSA